MTRYAKEERLALCDSMTEAGPDSPTLSGSWTVADLAAHLVIREGARPDLAAGILVPPLAARTDAATRRMARETPLGTLVDRVRTGPPAWHPTRVPAVDEAMNLVEMFVHHEDVRRGRGSGTPRDLSDGMRAALTRRLTTMAPLLLRGVKDVDVEIVTAKTRKRVGSGHPVVEVHGSPGEILLYLYGRKGVAEVELVGDPAVVSRLAQARLGM